MSNIVKILDLMRSKTTLFISIILVVVLGSSIAVYAITSKNAHNRGVIALVGDSNITLASTNIIWELTWMQHNDNAYAPVFLSRVGSGIRTPDCIASTCTTTDFWKIKFAETWPKLKPNVVVVNLGINDTASIGTSTGPGYSYYGKKIDWLMQIMPAGKKVLWSNLPCAIEPANRKTGCNYINNSLNQAKGRWSNLIILDWASIANSHPEYINTGDVHYTGAGNAAYSKALVDKLDTLLPVPND